jgi:hypothetical protein
MPPKPNLDNLKIGQERIWAESKGPRRHVSVRLDPDAAVILKAAAAMAGVSRMALAAEILERWADRWFAESLADVKQALADERRRRET